MSNYGRDSLTGCLHTCTHTHTRKNFYMYIRFLSNCDHKSESEFRFVVQYIDFANRESTPPTGTVDGLTPSEELVHLRRQMAKLNRRVMAIELDNLQRQQREKIIYVIGLAYFFFKTVFWLARSS